MSKPVAWSIAITCGSLFEYYLSNSSASFSYAKAFLFSILIYYPVRLTWFSFLYPFCFSPLRSLPYAPNTHGWRGYFMIRTGDEVLEMIDTIPNNGFIRYLDIMNSEAIVLTQPKLIAEFLQAKSYDYTKLPAGARILKNILGNGLVTSEGVEHKHQRKYLLPAFNVKVIRNLYPLFWTKASELVTLMKREIGPGSANIDIDDWAGRVSLDIIGQAGFGSEFNSLSNPHTPLNDSYRGAFLPSDSSRIFFLLSVFTHPKLVNMLPFKRTRQLREGIRAVTDFVGNLIDDRQRNMAFKKPSTEDTQKDIITAAMETEAFDTMGLVDQSMTLLGAGHETSATAVTWGIYLLSQPRYAHVQERLRQEIRENLPSPTSGIDVHADMLEKLPYLDAVSKEILRVRGPVPQLGRRARVESEIGGQRIPEGTSIRVNIWSINKTKHFWGEDAREFKPERWLEDKVNGGASESLAYLTFGHGPRGCIGRGFAIAENKALLAALIGSFEFKPVGGKVADIRTQFAITAKIIGGLKVEVRTIEGW